MSVCLHLGGNPQIALGQGSRFKNPDNAALRDSILIERVYIPRPGNYQPGDMLIQKDIFLNYEDMKVRYRLMMSDGKIFKLALDTMSQANFRLAYMLDSMKQAHIQQMDSARDAHVREIEKMEMRVSVMSDRILLENVDNMQMMKAARRDYKKIKRADRKKYRSRPFMHNMDKDTRRAVWLGGGLSVLGVAAALLLQPR